MANSLYLEHYLESIESLPYDLQRNFSLQRDLDQRAHDLLDDIDKLCEEYISKVRDLPPIERKDFFSKIENAFQKSREYGDDKVQLAVQTYEMVDKHIRRLDSDLSRFEDELKQQRQQQGCEEEGRKRKSDKTETVKKKKKGKKGEDSDEPTGMMSSLSTSATPLITMATDMNVLDMPVDPNEPTYCLCHQVSYGEMIGCDNSDCLIEWFHFGCVGLTTKPKGKWFCPKCSAERKKR
ncbi:inhibitor of growth protein 4-like isoform X2 [Hydractinia symbiolongicarpus]|uniref:inhibitor of growth protein 4-like isoform X2 n=1 Tax=Hydractinia symbiolongicarpus TaxID=13093 RepID=UPI00254D1010|nr:inhibitor of growth protein 4-like isoform X2 [Hydractinia symbiolongicarpus]